jgi:glycosyltransferase involved in cell wall biosynthesis
MRVAWDARVLVNGPLRGMGTYALHLLQELRNCRPNLDLVLFHDGGNQPLPFTHVRSKRIGPARGYRWQLWEQFGLPLHAVIARSDLIHSLANTTPPRSPLPRVVTLHDAMPFHSWNTEANQLPYFQHTQRRALASADIIITVSDYSKQEICQVLRVASEKVRVIPQAPNPDLIRPSLEQRQSVISTLGISPPFVLALAATADRKNTRGVLRAFAALPREVADVTLVLTGINKPLKQTLLEEMRSLQVPEDRVRLLDFVSTAQLAALYAECAVFCFLSLYEGFGLPILDAMQCGAPVVCSNRTSCPEVAGEAAVIVDPANSEEVAAGISAVLARDADAQEVWRQRGFARSAGFTWRQTAELTADVYDSVVS